MTIEFAEYGFLFGLAFIWIIFAVAQDLKKREVADWLNFSLIAFALTYRAFYSAYSSDFTFFMYGVLGFALFFLLANLFYYSHVFAGGDAKLLMGLGIILPYSNYSDVIFVGLGFVLLLFLVGAVYSLSYSVFIVRRNYEKFFSAFRINLNSGKNLAFALIFAGFFVGFIYAFSQGDALLSFLGILFAVFAFFLVVYAKSLEVCMIKLVSPGKLTEGDWLVSDVRAGRGIVAKKTVHGLNLEEIVRLRKRGKKVLIREGIPFTPAFLFAFLVMVFFLAVLGFDLNSLTFSFLA